jgi:hypothetical protein
MNTIKTYILVACVVLVAGSASAQVNAVKQYCGGSRGSVTSPAYALENDFVKHSRLKLRTAPSSSCQEYVYQNFIFPSESKKGTKITFILQGDEGFVFGKERNLNIKFYTLSEGTTNRDTLVAEETQVKKVKGTEDMYEFTFYSKEKFNEAGIMIYKGGVLNTIKIYGVYEVEASISAKSISMKK